MPAPARTAATVAGRDHRAGDDHAGAGHVVGVRLGQLQGQRDRLVHPARRHAPARRRRPPPPARPARPDRHRPGRGVRGDHDLVERRPAPRGCRGRPCRAITADHADQPGEAELRGRARRPSAPAPCGLCAASSRIVGERAGTRSSRPGERDRGERRPARRRCRAAGCGAGAEERLDRGQRERRVAAPGARRAAAGRCPRRPRRGPAG